jgi:hypothetical protein
MNTKIVRVPGWVSDRREREKRDHEHKDRTNNRNDDKKRCRKRVGNTVDGAAIWPNRRVGHNKDRRMEKEYMITSRDAQDLRK